MNTLQDMEQLLLDGDLNALNDGIEKLQATTEYDLLYDVANLLIDYGFIGQADGIFSHLLLVFPDEAQLKIDRAAALLELGEEDEALLLLTEIGPDEEEYVQALLAQADYYQMVGLAETALAKVREASELAPHEPVIQLAQAELLLDSGRYSEAVRLYKKLLETAEELAGVKLTSRLAEAYSAGAAYEEAIPYYEELLNQETNPEELFGLGLAYYQTERYADAISRLKRLIEMDPDYFSAYMLAGQSHAQLNEDDKALEFYKMGIERDTFDKELQLAAGKSALKLQLPEEAERYLKEALVLDPEYIDALVTLASLYNQREEDELLIELLTYSEADQLEIPLLHAFLAYAYERTEVYKEAYEMYRKAYDGMNEDAGFLDSYAKFLLEEGKHAEAQRVIRQLVKIAPDAEEWTAYLEAQSEEEV
ncbi:tetratricopeptide repeat protein [Sporosarcina newyorkensis]|uniref:Tetratricopeptide repeat-containing protein n=1 Tax=Sporosarcina newyorkensis TaxID=759851 RepID=A0A1T4XD04_9BACL|nr:tetratricopeptide repeat protein [Sporosarcina newyorkensis]SKA87470.1 Tetratricopeptide repeat-containing protein [Sporosarcina newyorkensis]